MWGKKKKKHRKKKTTTHTHKKNKHWTTPILSYNNSFINTCHDADSELGLIVKAKHACHKVSLSLFPSIKIKDAALAAGCCR